MSQRPFVSLRRAAAIMGVSETSVYKAVHAGTLPVPVEKGESGHYRVRTADLRRYLDGPNGSMVTEPMVTEPEPKPTKPTSLVVGLSPDMVGKRVADARDNPTIEGWVREVVLMIEGAGMYVVGPLIHVDSAPRIGPETASQVRPETP